MGQLNNIQVNGSRAISRYKNGNRFYIFTSDGRQLQKRKNGRFVCVCSGLIKGDDRDNYKSRVNELVKIGFSRIRNI